MSRLARCALALAAAASLSACLLDPNGRWACDIATGQDCVDAGPGQGGGVGGGAGDAGGDAGRAVPVITLADVGPGAALFGSRQTGLAMTGDGRTLFAAGTWADGGVFVVEVQATDAGLTPRAFISHGAAFWDDEWGAALAVTPDGQRLAIGARTEASSDGGAAKAGAVHLLVRDGGGWWEEARLEPRHGAVDLNFGQALAFSADGARLAVGSDAWSPLSGVVEVWARTGAAWRCETELRGVAGDTFGFDVALDATGSLLVVGAPSSPGTMDFDAPGAVSTFRRTGATWTLAQSLAPGGVSPTGRFGTTVEVSASGQVLVVGEPSWADAEPSGLTFYQAVDGGFGAPVRQAGAMGDHVGRATALSADGAWLAATVWADGGRVDVSSAAEGWQVQRTLSPTAELGEFPFETLALSADGRTLAASQLDSAGHGALLVSGP